MKSGIPKQIEPALRSEQRLLRLPQPAPEQQAAVNRTLERRAAPQAKIVAFSGKAVARRPETVGGSRT